METLVGVVVGVIQANGHKSGIVVNRLDQDGLFSFAEEIADQQGVSCVTGDGAVGEGIPSEAQCALAVDPAKIDLGIDDVGEGGAVPLSVDKSDVVSPISVKVPNMDPAYPWVESKGVIMLEGCRVVSAFIQKERGGGEDAITVGFHSDDIAIAVAVEVAAEFDGIDEGILDSGSGDVVFDIGAVGYGIVVFAPLDASRVVVLVPG